MGLRKTLRTLWQMKKIILSLLTPVFLLPILYNVDGDVSAKKVICPREPGSVANFILIIENIQLAKKKIPYN